MLCMDLVGSLPLSNFKNKYILTIFDQFSRFVVTVPIPDKRAKTVCSSIYTRWIAFFGSPDSIRTDARTEFTSNLLSNMMLKMGVHIKIYVPYNHQSNSVERFHRIYGTCSGQRWRMENKIGKNLLVIELAYNSSLYVSTSTGCSLVRLNYPTYPCY